MPPLLPNLTLEQLKVEVHYFVQQISQQPVLALYGVTDGKAVGTYVEQLFRQYLSEKYTFIPGNSAVGIDFPELKVDLKVTSIRQPQSSCPFRDAGQKIYGLGYNLIVLIYEKIDDLDAKAAKLTFQHAVFVTQEETADYQTTFGLTEILRRNGNK